MKGTTKYERYLKLIKNRMGRLHQSVRLATLYGRFIGEKVFLTSIPKAGTNLIIQLLINLPTYRIYIGKGLRPWMFESENDLIKK